MRKYFIIIIALSAVILTGCETSGSSSTPSSVAKLLAFSLKNDSMPGLAKAVFTVEERLDTGLVWNQDSIQYGTRLDSVIPKFTFAATPGAAILYMPDTTVRLTGYDTLDFTVKPIYLAVRSADQSTTKVYEIRPTVHSMDPDLYTWEQLTPGIYPPNDSEQRVVETGGLFTMIVSNGFTLHAYSSSDGASWIDLGQPTGLPAGTKVRQIISDGHTLYYGQEQNIYTSTDGITWEAHAVSFPVRTMLLYWNEHVWALVEDPDGYELATYEGDDLVLSGLEPYGEFPVSDFATVTFQNASGRQRAMIIGGFAENGRSLNTRWNLERVHFMDGSKEEYRMEEFTIDRPSFTSLTGISVIWYNKQLLLFGGVNEEMSYFGRDILISTDEGISWTKADTAKNRLPEVYYARQKQTAIVRNNTIYLFGGQDNTTTYSDAYKGRLNSIDWLN